MTTAGQPTQARSVRAVDGTHRAFRLPHLAVASQGVRVTAWFAPELFPGFGRPETLPVCA